jgi:type I restriction enzyme, S subunit
MSSKVKSPAAMGDETAMVPKRRFPEFEKAEGWKETALQKLARPVADRATTEGADNVLSLSGEHGLVLQSEYFGKKIAGDSVERYIKIRKDDFVYNDRTTKASSFGTIKRLSKYSGGIVSPIYKCFRFQPIENPVFWEWYFESGSHDPALGGLINEGARAGRFNISVTQFLSTNAWRPDEPEQQKIANCLDAVDALIAAQGRKVEALRAHEKGLMQQLFPQDGETQPRLRFPEFRDTGEWEEKPLGKIVEVTSGLVDPTVPPYCDMPHIGGENIESENVRLKPGKSARELGLISGKYLFDSGHVLYSKIRPALNKVALPDFEGISSAEIYPIRPSIKKLSRFFLAYLLLSETFLKYATMHSDRSKIPKVNREALLAYEVGIPSLPEQNRIADCFTSIDDLIAAETQKLDTLKTHKKGLMQQLFPQVGKTDA